MNVGDIVTVGRQCLNNPAGVRAVVVEVYDRGKGSEGIGLLFPNGSYDGFSPDDCEMWNVQRVEHSPLYEAYEFKSVLRLDRDWRAGLFDGVWRSAS